MTTNVQITIHKHAEALVRVSLVSVTSGDVLSHHDVIAGHCEETCVFTIYEGARLFIEEREPERIAAPAPPPALPSQENPAATADAPQPETVGGQPAAEGQQPELASTAEPTAPVTQAPVQNAPAVDAPSTAAKKTGAKRK